MLCGLIVIFAYNSSATRWCSRSDDNTCLIVDISTDDLMDDFNSTYNVRALTFDWSVIRNFPSVIKTTSRFRKVTYIDLSCLSIENVRKIRFDFIESLDTLEMGLNNIEALPKNLFEFVPTITTLRLERNQIKAIHKNAFNGLTDLVTLLLSYNQLKEIDSQIFLPMQKLDSLSLWGNRLQDIENVNFPKTLTELNLGHNSIAKGLTKLLDLENLTGVYVQQICYKSGNVNCCDELETLLEVLTNREVVVFEKPWIDDCSLHL